MGFVRSPVKIPNPEVMQIDKTKNENQCRQVRFSKAPWTLWSMTRIFLWQLFDMIYPVSFVETRCAHCYENSRMQSLNSIQGVNHWKSMSQLPAGQKIFANYPRIQILPAGITGMT